MGNVIQPAESRTHDIETILHQNGIEPLIEDFTPRSSRNHSGEEKRVRFQNVEITDQKNVVVVKANENRSSASSSGYESKSCSSIDSDAENIRGESSETVSPLCSSAIKDILTCDECGKRFCKSGLYLQHIRTRAHLGCNPDDIIDQTSIKKIVVAERQYPSPKTIAKAHADSIRKTRSYNTERDLLWVSPEKLRPKSARPEHRILGPLGNSYLHWLTHLERLDRLDDETESSDTGEDRSPPSTGESTLC
ncbi:uncharacterized protein LOC134820550 isoform X2 [Bolinopsis microptera]|uniref:uncharacterized protein LOC134820550 isoform X2 n=1 Tax=Bolinopsis microptera TaxID=2820187 RepID=UPI003078FAF0